MSLENLLKIKRLQIHNASQDSILKLLASAERNLDDARAQNISTENRFGAAYKTILQCAMAALWANGYRPPHQRARTSHDGDSGTAADAGRQ